jgi:hypothetical protein
MLWLLEQGFIVVTGDNSIWFPKGDKAPAPTPVPGRNNKGKKNNDRKRKPASLNSHTHSFPDYERATHMPKYAKDDSTQQTRIAGARGAHPSK